jgi:hypothetical protein
MAARTTMAPLITKVRELTNAVTGDFTDDQVQAFLDRHRIEFRYQYLCELATRAAGGVVEYKTFTLERLAPRMIEGNAGSDPDAYFLYDNSYAALTPTTEDLVNGRWTFTTQPAMPVIILCWAYDFYAAAVDLLEEWAAKLRTAQTLALKSFKDNGQEFVWQSDEKATSLSGLADEYRKHMCLESTHIYDADSLPW